MKRKHPETEHAILFNGQMVRAYFAGKKTQTRRIMKPQLSAIAANVAGHRVEVSVGGVMDKRLDRSMMMLLDSHGKEIKCPYGEEGHTLIGRETFLILDNGNIVFKSGNEALKMIKKWTPGIHMPWELSRIRPKIESIRIERLQDITPADARAEGIDDWHECLTGKFPTSNYLGLAPEIFPNRDQLAIANYARLFESINGLGAWKANPWVWVITFERFKG